jgi:hypothetical protein
MNGKGKIIYANGGSYEGDFVDGLYSGYGLEFTTNDAYALLLN